MNFLSTPLLLSRQIPEKANIKVAKLVIHPSPKHINTID